MSRTEDLAPLLDLPRTQLELVRDEHKLVVRNSGSVAALGLVLEDARPTAEPGLGPFLRQRARPPTGRGA